jgi:hypothetical protein
MKSEEMKCYLKVLKKAKGRFKEVMVSLHLSKFVED